MPLWQVCFADGKTSGLVPGDDIEQAAGNAIRLQRCLENPYGIESIHQLALQFETVPEYMDALVAMRREGLPETVVDRATFGSVRQRILESRRKKT